MDFCGVVLQSTFVLLFQLLVAQENTHSIGSVPARFYSNMARKLGLSAVIKFSP